MTAELKRTPIIFITGLSGAGLSSAINILEDLGYKTVDSLPLDLVGSYLEKTAGQPTAIGMDVRSIGFSPELVLTKLEDIGKANDRKATLLYLHCDDMTLQRRFMETRRRHPLAHDRAVIDGIVAEKALLAPLRDAADHVIDTSDYSIHDLKRVLSGHFEQAGSTHLTVTLMSFSYRRGVPRDADFVFDVRFLNNPHWVAVLRTQTGLDQAVRDYITLDPDYRAFEQSLKKTLDIVLPRSVREGKSYLTLAFGCTGGRHRSVHFAEFFAKYVREKHAGNPLIVHRDLQIQ